jgi:hypothetical protein
MWYTVVAYVYMSLYVCVYFELITISVSLVDVTMMDLQKIIIIIIIIMIYTKHISTLTAFV